MSRQMPALLFAICLSLAACCDRETKRIQSHWLRAGEGFYLGLVRMSASDEFVPIVGSEFTASWFKWRGLDAEIRVQEYGFWLDVTNTGKERIHLLWPEARYVDEKGVRHELFRQPMGALPPPSEMKVSQPATLSAGDRVHDVIAPIYKSYLVASGCKDLIPYREPLVPTMLDDKDEAQMKAYVDDLSRRQVPVKLVLPIEIDGVRYDYTFAFVLKDRAAPPPKE